MLFAPESPTEAPDPEPTAQATTQPASLTDPGGLEIIVARLRDMWEGFLALVPNLIVALILLVIFALLARLGSRIMHSAAKRAHLRPSLRDLFGQLVYLAIWIIGILVAVTVIFPTITPGRLIAGLGITSIALGFAFKDIVENFLAGILILWRFPIEIGDFIEVDGVEGRIERINIRMTELRQVDGDLVVLPNAKLFKEAVTNYTNWRDRRVTVICGVAYSEDVGESRRVISEAVKACETVRRSAARPVEIFAQEFAESSINFEVTWWTGSTPLEIRKSKDEVVEAVKRALDNAGIEIPFPYRTLTFKEPLALNRDGA